jgi:hypothetical protein
MHECPCPAYKLRGIARQRATIWLGFSRTTRGGGAPIHMGINHHMARGRGSQPLIQALACKVGRIHVAGKCHPLPLATRRLGCNALAVDVAQVGLAWLEHTRALLRSGCSSPPRPPARRRQRCRPRAVAAAPARRRARRRAPPAAQAPAAAAAASPQSPSPPAAARCQSRQHQPLPARPRPCASHRQPYNPALRIHGRSHKNALLLRTSQACTRHWWLVTSRPASSTDKTGRW